MCFALPACRRFPRWTLVLVAAFLAIGGPKNGSRAGHASYSGTVDATLTVLTAPVNNVFGYESLPGVESEPTPHDTPPASTAQSSATVTLINPGGAIEGKSTVSGMTVPTSHADSNSATSGEINLGNLSGSPLTVMLKLSFEYSIEAHAQTALDQAEALYEVDVKTNAQDFLFNTPVAMAIPGPKDDDHINTVTQMISVTIPAHSNAPVYLRTLAFGFADSTDVAPLPPPTNPPPLPPTLPEPSSWVMMTSGVLGGFLYLVRRRKRGKVAID